MSNHGDKNGSSRSSSSVTFSVTSGYGISADPSQQVTERSFVSQEKNTKTKSLEDSIKSEHLSLELSENDKQENISQSDEGHFELRVPTAEETAESDHLHDDLFDQRSSSESERSHVTTVKTSEMSDLDKVTSSETIPVSLLTKTRRSSSLTNLKMFGVGNEFDLEGREYAASDIVKIKVEEVNSDSGSGYSHTDQPTVFPQPINIPYLPSFGRSQNSNSRASSAIGSVSLRSGRSYKNDDGQLSVSKLAK